MKIPNFFYKYANFFNLFRHECENSHKNRPIFPLSLGVITKFHAQIVDKLFKKGV